MTDTPPTWATRWDGRRFYSGATHTHTSQLADKHLKASLLDKAQVSISAFYMEARNGRNDKIYTKTKWEGFV